MEMMFLSIMMILSLNLISKWNKLLLVIILLEAMTVVIMASMIMESTSQFIFVFVLFSFFVSEALIILTSLYSSMRNVGYTNSSLIFS